jgi:hypothetical protein
MTKGVSLLTKILLLFFALSACRVSGQKPQNEISVYAGGGVAAYCFQPKVKNASSIGYGGDAGVGFTGFFSPHWGIHIGAGVGFYQVTNKVKNFIFVTPEQADCEGRLYNLHTALNDYKEVHKPFFMSVPLMLQFQTKMNQSYNWKKDKKWGYYAMAGLKAQLMFSYNYTSEIAVLNNAAYYPEFDNWITFLPTLGLGTHTGISVSRKLNFELLAMFAFETGAKFRIGKITYLYTGVFFDCALHDPVKKYRKPYRNDTSSERIIDLTLLEFAKKANLMAAGIKLRLAFLIPPKEGPCYR